MNNTVGPSFKVNFAEFCTSRSREQFTRSTEKKRKHKRQSCLRYPNPTLEHQILRRHCNCYTTTHPFKLLHTLCIFQLVNEVLASQQRPGSNSTNLACKTEQLIKILDNMTIHEKTTALNNLTKPQCDPIVKYFF